MRIAFVGKGGSGKTTLSVLYSLYLDTNHVNVGLLDVDVNSHTASVLGLLEDSTLDLSSEPVTKDIRTYLRGNNVRVSVDDFLNSTPPGTGSGYFTLRTDNYITRQYGRLFGNSGHLFTAGSYKEAAIGVDCHHSTQYIAENLLSHARLDENDAMIIDAVAGNDIFGNSLYMQDMMVFVVKPEREGVNVFRRFYDIAQKAGMGDRVYAIGNQVYSDRQKSFLEAEIPKDTLLGIVPMNDELVNARLEENPLNVSLINEAESTLFESITKKARSLQRPASYYYDEIVKLHKTLSNEGWVIGAYRPNMTDQIDPTYTVSH